MKKSQCRERVDWTHLLLCFFSLLTLLTLQVLQPFAPIKTWTCHVSIHFFIIISLDSVTWFYWCSESDRVGKTRIRQVSPISRPPPLSSSCFATNLSFSSPNTLILTTYFPHLHDSQYYPQYQPLMVTWASGLLPLPELPQRRTASRTKDLKMTSAIFTGLVNTGCFLHSIVEAKGCGNHFRVSGGW